MADSLLHVQLDLEETSRPSETVDLSRITLLEVVCAAEGVGLPRRWTRSNKVERASLRLVARKACLTNVRSHCPLETRSHCLLETRSHCPLEARSHCPLGARSHCLLEDRSYCPLGARSHCHLEARSHNLLEATSLSFSG